MISGTPLERAALVGLGGRPRAAQLLLRGTQTHTAPRVPGKAAALWACRASAAS